MKGKGELKENEQGQDSTCSKIIITTVATTATARIQEAKSQAQQWEPDNQLQIQDTNSNTTWHNNHIGNHHIPELQQQEQWQIAKPEIKPMSNALKVRQKTTEADLRKHV